MEKTITFILLLYFTNLYAQLDTTKADITDFSVYDNCTPCYLIITKNGKKEMEGIRYSDCAFDTLKTYYPSGQIKLISVFTSFDKLTIDSGNCSILNGTRLFYSIEGKIIKKEIWENGILKE